MIDGSDGRGMGAISKEDSWYAAYVSRDRRFDGVFFLGVKSTYIYCRPVCPARTPKRQNVQFFTSAAAAEREGYRACRRCHPECAPLHRRADGVPEEVRRALHLVDNGLLDEHGVELLAARVGVTARHLRRLFAEHVGTSPRALAQARRARLAKQLIDQTALSLTQIAHEAGFRSVRTFNACIRRSFGATPTELRRRSVTPDMDGADLLLKISYRPPYPWEQVRQQLLADRLPGVEAVGDECFSKLLTTGSEVLQIRFRHRPDTHDFEFSVRGAWRSFRGVCDLVTMAKRFVDTAADPLQLEEHFAGSALADRFACGVRLLGAIDPLQVATRAILRQELTNEEATGCMLKLCEPVRGAMTEPGSLDRIFAPLQRLLSTEPSRVFPARSGRAIQVMGHAIQGGQIDLSPLASPLEVRDRLAALPGIAQETATEIAIRVTGYPDLSDEDDHASYRPWRSYARAARAERAARAVRE